MRAKEINQRELIVRIWKTSIIKSKIYKKKIEDPITTKKQVPNKIAIYHHIP